MRTMKPLAPTFSSLSTSRQIKTPGDRFVQGHFKCNAATLFQQVSSSCVIQRSRGALSCAAQAASQPSRAKIRKLLYHRFQSGGFLLVMYNRRDRRVIPSRNSRGTFHPRGKRCHDSLDLFLITTTILP